MAIPNSLTVDQYRAAEKPVPADTVIVDTQSKIESLTIDEIRDLAANGVTALDATDDKLSLSVNHLEAPGYAVSISSTDKLTLVDERTIIESLSYDQLDLIFSKGVDVIDSRSDNSGTTIS